MPVRARDTDMPPLEGQLLRHCRNMYRDVGDVPCGQDTAQWAVMRHRRTRMRKWALHEHRPAVQDRWCEPWLAAGVPPEPAELPNRVPGSQEPPAVHRA